MAYTQTDLDNIDRAIATGEQSVSVEGRTVTYRSMGELKAARDLIRKELAAGASTARPPTFGGRAYGLASFNQD